MRKTMILILLVFALCLLSSCYKKHNFDYEILASEVKRVEIVHVIQEWGSLEYDIITEIDEEHIEAFLLELSQISYIIPFYGDRGSLNDKTCIKLIYENGDFDMISFYLMVKFRADNTKIKWIKISFFDQVSEFFALVDKYAGQ